MVSRSDYGSRLSSVVLWRRDSGKCSCSDQEGSAMNDEPSVLLLFVLGMGAIGLMIFLLWANHKWVTRGRPKSEAPAIVSRPLPAPSPTLTDALVAWLLRTERANASAPVQ